jgi:hypothetical protein
MHLIEAIDATMRDIDRDAKAVVDPELRSNYACVFDCFRMLKQRLEEKGPSSVGVPVTPIVTGNKSIDDVLRFFKYDHLPPDLQAVSIKFAKLAYEVAGGPHSAETTVCLRKLMEAKDAAVRAIVVTK